MLIMKEQILDINYFVRHELLYNPSEKRCHPRFPAKKLDDW